MLKSQFHTFPHFLNQEIRSACSAQKPSGFFIENGWGGRIIDPETWQPIETFEGPSFWGHERLYLSDEERMKFRNKRLETASQGKQAPLLIDCPWLYSNLKKK